MDSKKVIKKFQYEESKWLSKATKYSSSDTFNILKNKALTKVQSGGNKFKDGYSTVTRFLKMIHDFFKNDFLLEKKELLLMLAGLVYFISPIDIVPDFIPFVGLLDDFAVLAFIAKRLSGTMDKYEEYVNEDKNKNYIDVESEEV